MKISLLVLLIAFTATLVSAQWNSSNERGDEKVIFDRKGKILVETGYNLFGGLPIGGGTGFTLITDSGESISSLGFNGGYFISQNFALKFGYSNLSGGGSSISSYLIGGKLYAGKVPIDLTLGTFTDGNNGSFVGNLSVGYAIELASNIMLEPSLGVFGTDNDGLFSFKVNFAMFL